MYFTSEDYEKIVTYIKQNGIKDTEYPVATILNKNDTITIVQDNQNKQILAKRINDVIPSSNFVAVNAGIVKSGSTILTSSTRVAINATMSSTGTLLTNYKTTVFKNVNAFHVVDTTTSTSETFISGVYNIVCPRIDGFTTLDQFAVGSAKLTSLDTSAWDTSKVTSLNRTFEYCQNLKTLNVTTWDLSQVKYMNSTFYACLNLNGINTSFWNLSNLLDMEWAFYSCVSLSALDCSNWNPNKCTNFLGTFGACTNIQTLDLSTWEVTPTESQYMFYGCSNLSTLRLDKWNNSKNLAYDSMFTECSALEELYLGPNFFNCPFTQGTGYLWDFSSIANWSDESLIYSLVTNLYDRKAHGYTSAVYIFLNTAVYNKLTDAQKTAITNKKFILMH